LLKWELLLTKNCLKDKQYKNKRENFSFITSLIWSKLHKNTDPINHELYILVRGIPTKSKIVWEKMANIKKVFDMIKA